MVYNPWMSASLSAVNRAYHTAAGSAAAQARAATAAQQAQLRSDFLDVQRDLTEAWLDLWMPGGGSKSSSGGSRKRSGSGSGSRSRSRR